VPGSPQAESLPVIEMKLVHDVHRAATSLLATGAARPGPRPAELTELRDFVVAALRHHHQSEDDALWPICAAIDPGLVAGLRDLSAEHDELDAALDTLDAAAPGGLAGAAGTVRELVDQHLAHEEPVTMPVLRRLTAAQWAEFSRVVMATTPPAGAYLQIGFMDEVGDPGDVATVLAGLPAPAAEALPALRDRARTTLAALRAGQPVTS
jgi:iron-sulfur cluster repair protein YtfE (RIC family)